MSDTVIDPVVFTDRACRGVDQEAFFPAPRKLAARKPAQRLCRACPVLARCAAFAAAEAAAGRISECVIASVYVPRFDRRSRAQRAAAVAELTAIAAGVSVREVA